MVFSSSGGSQLQRGDTHCLGENLDFARRQVARRPAGLHLSLLVDVGVFHEAVCNLFGFLSPPPNKQEQVP